MFRRGLRCMVFWRIRWHQWLIRAAALQRGPCGERPVLGNGGQVEDNERYRQGVLALAKAAPKVTAVPRKDYEGLVPDLPAGATEPFTPDPVAARLGSRQEVAAVADKTTSQVVS